MPASNPEWTSRGKTIAQLIRELGSFEDQTLEARISLDGGRTSVPISLVARLDDAAVILNAESPPSTRRHD